MLSRLNAAVSVVATAVRIQPERADARNMLGLALASVGRTAEAIEQYERALQVRPDFPGARFNLANVLTRAESFAEALAEYRKVLAAAPADGALRNRVAGVLAARAEQLSAQEKSAGAVAFLRGVEGAHAE
jgi:tetratricopeptide (TPR) repeat protein